MSPLPSPPAPPRPKDARTTLPPVIVPAVPTNVTSVLDDIAANAQSVSSNAAALTSLFASTVGGPLVKVAAFSHGIRSAASKRRVAEANRLAKKEESRGRQAVGV